jgi:hypothetical protein
MTILQILAAWSAVALATSPLVGGMLRRMGASRPCPRQPTGGALARADIPRANTARSVR